MLYEAQGEVESPPVAAVAIVRDAHFDPRSSFEAKSCEKPQ
jgi:hypothetical protein